MVKHAFKLGLTLAIFTSAQTFAGYNTLEQTRPKIKFPKYSKETRSLVFNQAKLILSDIFVHRDLKIKDFGEAANTAPKLAALEKRLPTISDKDFHETLTDIFLNLKDLHTLYYLPKPYACYETLLPFNLRQVNMGLGKKAIAIYEVDTEKEIVDLLPKNFKIAPGDIVLSYNGKPILDVIKERMPKSYGANKEAQFRHTLDDLRYYNHEIDHVPAANKIEIELQNAKGERYKQTIPWLTWTNEKCLASQMIPVKATKSKKMGSIKGETEEPILYWHINRPDFGNFGYIELTSFNPEVLSNDQTTLKIRDLLLNELKDTDGLVIDLRSNGGGQIPLAEKIIQLFSPHEVTPLQYILRNTETNYVYFRKSDIDDIFTQLLETARRLGTPYSAAGTISDKAEINDLGQAYFKPMAVFVNSKCYSSCEVFAAQVQDHEVGTVFGEDLQTGGGGANYYTLNKILDEKFTQNDPAPFAKLPAGQDINFAFRQAVRIGKNQGRLIEDEGVKADRLSPMSHRDIFNKTNDQLLVLQRYLSSLSGNYTSSIFFDSEERHDIVQSQTPAVNASWTDTTAFEFKKAGKTVEKREVSENGSVLVPLPISSENISDGTLEILGSNKDVPVWRKIIRYRIVPQFTSITKDEDILERISVYSVISTKENGWQKKNGELIVGDGGLYQNSVESEASLFVQVPATSAAISFDAATDLEKDFDFLKVSIVVEGEKPHVIGSFTGHYPMDNYTLNLDAYSGKNVEIRFTFKSDEGTRDKGVTLKNFKWN